MSKWVVKGLQSGVMTTCYPQKEEDASGVSPGFPQSGVPGKNIDEKITTLCPMHALYLETDHIQIDSARCIHCYRCRRNTLKPLPWMNGFEWAHFTESGSVLPRAFQKSLHIRVIDSGDCGACLNEIKLLNNPYYNMHRLGFFITPTPRQADVLLVVGPVTDHMKTAILKAYEAMPEPKRVIAAGSCALSGGIFGPGFVSGSGAKDILPVDIEIPGCPPPPLALLHGLLTLSGRTEEKEGGKTE